MIASPAIASTTTSPTERHTPSRGRSGKSQDDRKRQVVGRLLPPAWPYRLAMAVLPHLPPRIGYRLCMVCAALAPCLPVWERIRANLAQVVPEGDEALVHGHARDVTANLFKNYYDLLRSRGVLAQDLAETVSVTGLGNLLGALDRNKGAIVVMPHMGNFSMIAEPIVTMLGRSVLTVVEQMPDRAVHELVTRLRQRGCIEIVALGPGAVRRIMQQLRAGQIVVLFADRTVADSTVEVDFFGAPARVPAGPAALALRTGAPLLPAFTYRRADNSSTVVIDPPLRIAAVGERSVEAREVMQAVMRIFESYIRHHPGQWLLTEPIWTAA